MWQVFIKHEALILDWVLVCLIELPQSHCTPKTKQYCWPQWLFGSLVNVLKIQKFLKKCSFFQTFRNERNFEAWFRPNQMRNDVDSTKDFFRLNDQEKSAPTLFVCSPVDEKLPRDDSGQISKSQLWLFYNPSEWKEKLPEELFSDFKKLKNKLSLCGQSHDW